MEEIILKVSKEQLGELITEAVGKAVESLKPQHSSFYTRKEVAELLRISLPTLHNIVKNGELPFKKVGGRVLFDSEEVNKAIEEKRVYKYQHTGRATL